MWSKHVESANDMLLLSPSGRKRSWCFLLLGKLQIVLFSTNLPPLPSNWVNPTGIIFKRTKDLMANCNCNLANLALIYHQNFHPHNQGVQLRKIGRPSANEMMAKTKPFGGEGW